MDECRESAGLKTLLSEPSKISLGELQEALHQLLLATQHAEIRATAN